MSFRLSSRLLPRAKAIRFPTASNARTIFSSSSNSSPLQKFGSAAVLVAGTTLFLVYYFDSRSAIHRYFFTPLLRNIVDAETSHKIAVKVLRSGLAPKDFGADDERLAIELWGSRLSNPIGLAAGFDKDGEAIDGLFSLGFGWVEVGSVTPKPQPGNPQPRVFHLPDDNALINRYGFPSKGHTFLVSRLLARKPNSNQQQLSNYPGSPHLLSVNLGKNKNSPPDSVSDFLDGIRVFAPLVPVLVINVSSPNTPGLRSLQGRGLLEQLLRRAKHERDSVAEATGKKARLILKIAPDLTEEAVRDLGEAVRENEVDGVIVSNTTISRPDSLSSEHKDEMGGLSGRPLKSLSLKTVSVLRSELPSSIPIIGCGGISSGADALEFAQAGASAVQIYTAFGYGGVGTVRRIKDELTDELKRLNTTWLDVSHHAIDCLAWKPKPAAASPEHTTAIIGPGSLDIQDLIREAEDLKRQLNEVAVKYFSSKEDTPLESTHSETTLGESKDTKMDDAVPSIPPPGTIP